MNYNKFYYEAYTLYNKTKKVILGLYLYTIIIHQFKLELTPV